jgi:pentose-5-phosphate-3-epimerase
MIYTRWGSEVRITGYCGKHEVDGYCDRLMLVRAVRQADQLERYYLAVTLKADGGINEVEAAIDAAPAVTLHGSELYDAIQQAM